MNRALAMLVLAIAPSIAIAQFQYMPPGGDPPLTQMSGDIYGTRGTQQQEQDFNRTEPPSDPPAGDWHHAEPEHTTRNPLSDSMTVGSGINTAFDGARNAADWWDSSNLLDQEADRHYEPDLSGEGAPEIPASMCGVSVDCNQCYYRVFNGLDTMRYNLEKLRVAGAATSDFVSKSYAVGDGLSGVTGIAALQWQHERVGIGERFDHFKDTYDRKYEGMMKGLKGVMDRWDACEAQYGERDWYARFGFLYYQFMRDRYKRNF